MITPVEPTNFEPDAPLSRSELKLLLALPRAAEATPNATLFKIPCGPDPKLGFIDVSCTEAASIVSRLAAAWGPRLSPLHKNLPENQCPNIGFAVKPPVHGFFHRLAFWALGYCVQYFDVDFAEEVVDGLLRDGACTTILYLGDDMKEWAAGCTDRLKIPVLELPEEEFAINLAKREKEGPGRPAPPWPEARRPVPSIILHSSSSTNHPKLLRFPLQYWAQNLESHSEIIQSSGSLPSTVTPRAILMVSPPYWHTFANILVLHLATLVPFALVHTTDTGTMPAAKVLDWLVASGAADTVVFSLQAREMLHLAFNAENTPQRQEWARVITNMEKVGITGSDIDEELSDTFVRNGVTAMNLFGTSELGGLLLGTRPPYHYLRPYPDVPPPLAFPMSESGSDTHEDGSGIQRRLVQLWTLVSSHPRLKSFASVPLVQLNIEPYPGAGAAHGQPATKWGDLFYELRIPLDPEDKDHPDIISPDGGVTELVYLHAGRADDHIRLSSSDDVNAFEVETALGVALRSQLESLEGWELDTVQIFGTNRLHTALVVQLQRVGDGGSTADAVVQAVREAVKNVNREEKLSKETEIDAYRRTLVVTTFGEHLKVADEANWNTQVEQSVSKCGDLILSQTHKHTLQRWKNVKKFEPWLEQVCG
ncbi:hypothetical protein BDV93DRAFT_528329 [Ceratobasidium sp. AG-I]|nr:hypothetical protein BDV93DRAFT_528329 [Ceratobasidium sp. AG-I]